MDSEMDCIVVDSIGILMIAIDVLTLIFYVGTQIAKFL
jgi:hypothetical protein